MHTTGIPARTPKSLEEEDPEIIRGEGAASKTLKLPGYAKALTPNDKALLVTTIHKMKGHEWMGLFEGPLHQFDVRGMQE